MEHTSMQRFVRGPLSHLRGTKLTVPMASQEKKRATQRAGWVMEGSAVVTPDMAQTILQTCGFDGQRTVFDHQVNLLLATAESGEWLDDDQLSFCVLPDGSKYMVNGYHRMHMVIAYGKPLRFYFRMIPAKDMAHVRRIYVQFDTMIRKRSDAEIIDAMDVLDTFGLSGAVATKIYRAAPLLANKMRFYNYQTMPEIISNVTNKFRAAETYWAIGKTYQDYLTDATQRHKRRMLIPAIVATAMLTIKYQPEKAEKFWRSVASMEGLAINDPRLTLAKTLDERQYTVIYKNGTIPDAAIDASLAWNAFYRGRSLQYIRTGSCKKYKLDGIPQEAVA